MVGKKESPYGLMDEAFPQVKGKVIYCWNFDVENDEFRPPAKYYIVDAFGGHVYFKTTKREKAQQICDSMFGVKYTVKTVIRAAIR